MREAIPPSPFLVLDGFLAPEECSATLARMGAIGWTAAEVRSRDGSQALPGLRDNLRCEFSDPELAVDLADRLRARGLWPWLAQAAACGRGADSVRSWFRGYAYEGAQRFGAHRDGREREGALVSRVTLLVYLQEPESGGETVLIEPGPDPVKIAPKAGRLLAFASRLLHEAEPVGGGRKSLLRTDAMFPI